MSRRGHWPSSRWAVQGGLHHHEQFLKDTSPEERHQLRECLVGYFFWQEMSRRERLAGDVGGVLAPDLHDVVETPDRASFAPQHEQRAGHFFFALRVRLVEHYD